MAAVAAKESKDDVLLASLKKFYDVPANLEALADALGSKSLSLRVLDWFVTNYSKRTNIVYTIRRKHEERSFNVYLEYKSQLKGYSKRLFDPFSRRTRIEFKVDEKTTIHTTIGQLNFFRWAICNDVLKYSVENARAIEQDMLQRLKHREEEEDDGGKDIKRRELSKAAIKSLTNTKVVITLKYN